VKRREVLKRLAALGLVAPTMAVERTYFFGPFWSQQRAKLWGDGVHDDAPGLQWYLDHEKQIPKGLYRSGTLLKFRSWPQGPENMGALQQRYGPDSAGALIKYTPSAEFGQNSGLAAEAMGLKQKEVRWREFRKEWEALRRLEARNPTPDEREAEVLALSERSEEVVRSLPAVDYSGLTPEQAREALYRAFVEHFQERDDWPERMREPRRYLEARRAAAVARSVAPPVG
jgi:hypothetical protein